jgi:hypothetical protein
MARDAIRIAGPRIDIHASTEMMLYELAGLLLATKPDVLLAVREMESAVAHR